MELIKLCEPKHVILVNGEREIMQRLQIRIMDSIKLECFVSEIGETCVISVPIKIPSNAKLFLEKLSIEKSYCAHLPHLIRRPRMTGVLIIINNHIVPMTIQDALRAIGTGPLFFKYCIELEFIDPDPNWETINKLFIILKGKLLKWNVMIRNDRTITVRGVEIKLVKNKKDLSQTLLSVLWKDEDEDISFYILNIFQNMS